MRLGKAAVFSVMAVGLACGPAGRAAQAGVYDGLTGITRVAGAADRIQQRLLATVDRVSLLLERTNVLVSARLDQAHGIVALAIGGA